jgi:hypothetical protein
MRVCRRQSLSLYVLRCNANEVSSRGKYAQDIFTVKTAYFEGQPPKSVNMYWRRFALSTIPIDDPVAFEVWLRARWMEKDALIEAYYIHGRFPADRGAHKTRDGKIVRGAGHIETEIKTNYWYEFLQIFAPVGLIALVLYAFYNALPKTYTKALNRQNVIKADEVQRTQTNLQTQQLLAHPATSVSTDQNSLLAKGMSMYTDLSKNPSVRKVVQLPELTAQGFKNEMVKHQPAIDTILTQKNALRDLKPKLPTNRAILPPSRAPNQAIQESNSNRLNGAQAKLTRQKPGERKTDVPIRKPAAVGKPASKKPVPAKPTTKTPTPVKAVLPKPAAKQSVPQKLTSNKPQQQLLPSPKLQSGPKTATLKAAPTTNSTTT